ncbi:MAG: outer membrane protein transport protein [Alcanivoracaceae bacterium]|nr:outer membrane protein transport protein [Alcanivoracaceae bacterium]
MRALAKTRCATVLASALFAGQSLAGMGNIGTNYGILPMDVGSAQALSMFNSQVSAIYYNPGYLTEDPRGELTLGLLHGDHELRATSVDGNGYNVRTGDVLDDTPTQQQLIGLKTDLTDLTKYDMPIYFGVMIGVEKYGKEMLAFDASTSREGQYLTYGRQPLFLNLGGAMEALHGISVGASALVTLHSEAELVAEADLAGNTQYETLTANAKPSIRPVVGVNLDWGKLICGNNDCITRNLETAFAFRGHSTAKTSVTSNITIPGTVNEPGVTIMIDAIDSYQPDIMSFGVHYRFTDNLRVAASVEQQNWSDLSEELARDTVRDQANLQFEDVTVPRIGAELAVGEHFLFTAGIAVQDSPLKSVRSEDVNYFDNDRIIVGLGSTLRLDDPPILAYPLRLDFGYQYQQLKERDFELTTSNPDNPSNPYERVSADGDVHVFSGSLTLKF